MTTSMFMLIHEVAEYLYLSVSTVRRLHAKTRRGEAGGLPLAISEPGSKCRWLKSDLDRYIVERSSAATPVSPVSPAQQRRQQDGDYTRRQEVAKAVLARHRLGTDSSKQNTTKHTVGHSSNRAAQTSLSQKGTN